MANEGPARREDEDEEGSRAGRIFAVVLLIGAVLLVYAVLFRGDSYKVTAEFANAGQLVAGNEVVVGGAKVGTVDTVELGPQNEALVTFSVDEEYAPLRRGTVATVRSPSLSQIAGRQVQLTLPVDEQAGTEIKDGGTMGQSETVSAVDLDQLFNTLDPDTIKDFKHVIQGLELSYEGVGPQANRGLKYLNPFLSTSRRLFGELNTDQTALENLIVDSSKLSGALAARAPDVTALVGNLNRMMNAIGDRKERLAAAIAQFPEFMRTANTTFVNLRAALDDVDPLVDASKPVATELRPFLAKLRAAAADAVPTIRDLDQIVLQPGAETTSSSSPPLRPTSPEPASVRARPTAATARPTPPTSRPPPTTTMTRAPSAKRSARLTTQSSTSPSFAPTPRSWSGGSTISAAARASTTRSAASAGSARLSTSSASRDRAAPPTCSTP